MVVTSEAYKWKHHLRTERSKVKVTTMGDKNSKLRMPVYLASITKLINMYHCLLWRSPPPQSFLLFSARHSILLNRQCLSQCLRFDSDRNLSVIDAVREGKHSKLSQYSIKVLTTSQVGIHLCRGTWNSMMLKVILSLHFNGHFSGWTCISRFYWSYGWWRWWWQLEI